MAIMRPFLLLLLISLASPVYAGPIGTVEQQTGFAELIRKGEKQDTKNGAAVEMMDDVRTGNGIVGIGFEDNTKVRVDAHSKLIIDEFVYDPKKPTGGKLGLKVAMGTVRYASGMIAHNNNQNVSISTPTATIGVRGTAFSMTVDEVGKSLVILLPNADGTVGEITVDSEVGQVILNQAFQATTVGSTEMKPTPPVILDLSEAQISNLLIIQPPKEKKEEVTQDVSKSILDHDFLKYDELDRNSLDKDELEFTRLDINMLDVDLLANILDVLNKQAFQTGSFPNPIRAGSYEKGNLQIVKDSEVYITRLVDGSKAEVTLEKESSATVHFNQRGSNIALDTVQGGGSTVITINQN